MAQADLSVLSRLLRDPLLHFLAGGALLFALYGLVAGEAEERPDRIVVSEEKVGTLVATFERTWMRPPTRGELRALVDDHVTEEVLYREALALGLDRDDLVVRRRMRQKMEFLSEGVSDAEPRRAELSAFLEAHPERFEVPARTSFVQVLVGAESPRASAEQRAGDLLRRLRAAPDALAALGDRTLLPHALERATSREVAGHFGSDFAEALAELPERAWSGPIASSFGLHLVRVDAREPARVPPLDEVRDRVSGELLAQRREEARERFQRALRERYEIRLPESLAGASRPDELAAHAQ